MTRYYNENDAPFYTRIDPDFDEDKSGRGEVQIEDFELEKICSAVERMVRLVTYTVRMENEDVIIQRGKKRNSSSNAGSTAGLEYLSLKHLTEDKNNASSRFTVLWAGTPESAGVNNKYGAEVAVKVQRNTSGQRYWWMLSTENPNLETLLDGLGEDTDKWVNRELLIHQFVEMPSEKRFVRSECLPVAAQAKPAAATK